MSVALKSNGMADGVITGNESVEDDLCSGKGNTGVCCSSIVVSVEEREEKEFPPSSDSSSSLLSSPPFCNQD